MNTTNNPDAGVVQASSSTQVPKKRVIWQVVGWVAVGFAHYWAVLAFAVGWNLFDWTPRADFASVLLGAGITLTLASAWFLAKFTRDRLNQFVSAAVCSVLAWSSGGMNYPPERLSGGWLGRSEPSPWWFRGGFFVLFLLPAAFWLWHFWLPHATRAARHRILAAATCFMILAAVMFKGWDARKRAEMAATATTTPRTNEVGDQIWAAIADALMKGGPAPKPGLRAWQQIRVGLSREEVLAILGEPATKTKQNPTADAATGSSSSQEWWEYGYSSPNTGAVDPRAYAIFFDGTGHVTSFQEPSEPSK